MSVFTKLGLSQAIVDSLTKLGYEQHSPTLKKKAQVNPEMLSDLHFVDYINIL